MAVQGARLGVTAATAATAAVTETHGVRGLHTLSHVPCAGSLRHWSLARVEAAVEAAARRPWAVDRVPRGTRAISSTPPRQVTTRHPTPHDLSAALHPTPPHPNTNCLRSTT